jgi:hypothetical protein
MPRRPKVPAPEDPDRKIIIRFKNPNRVSASMSGANTVSSGGTKRKRSVRVGRGKGGGTEVSEHQPIAAKFSKRQATVGGTATSAGLESPKKVRKGKRGNHWNRWNRWGVRMRVKVNLKKRKHRRST